MNHGTCPNGAFRSRDSCPWRKGQPQAPYQAEFSVRIAHRNPKGTVTNTISNRFLCPNGLSGTGSMVRLAKLASTTETFSCIWYPVLHSQAFESSRARIIYSETVRTGTQLRYALYEDLGSDVRAFRLCANASEP